MDASDKDSGLSLAACRLPHLLIPERKKMKRSEGERPPKEIWRYYHRKDKDSPIEMAKGNANVIFSSTPDTHKMGLGAEIADLSGSPFVPKKVDFHTRQMVDRWAAFEPDGIVGEMGDAIKAAYFDLVKGNIEDTQAGKILKAVLTKFEEINNG